MNSTLCVDAFELLASRTDSYLRRVVCLWFSWITALYTPGVEHWVHFFPGNQLDYLPARQWCCSGNSGTHLRKPFRECPRIDSEQWGFQILTRAHGRPGIEDGRQYRRKAFD